MTPTARKLTSDVIEAHNALKAYQDKCKHLKQTRCAGEPRNTCDRCGKFVPYACKHENAIKVPKSDVGNWCPHDDSYWYECTCPDCGKYWIEDQ